MTERTKTARRLLVLPIVLVMAIALIAPVSALAETTATSTYGEKPPAPTTTSETEPTKTSTTPTTTTPTTTTTPAKEPAKTLPFTGFDLRWSFGIGLLLVLSGFGIVVAQRRRASDG